MGHQQHLQTSQINLVGKSHELTKSGHQKGQSYWHMTMEVTNCRSVAKHKINWDLFHSLLNFERCSQFSISVSETPYFMETAHHGGCLSSSAVNYNFHQTVCRDRLLLLLAASFLLWRPALCNSVARCRFGRFAVIVDRTTISPFRRKQQFPSDRAKMKTERLRKPFPKS